MKRAILFSGKNCPDCRVVEKMLEEIKSEIGVPVEIVDVEDIDYEVAFDLLNHQIYVGRTPTMVMEDGDDFKILFSGVPNIEDLCEMLKGD